MENKKQIFLNSNVDWFEAQLIMEICWGNSGLASKLSLDSLTDSRCLRLSLPTHLHLNFLLGLVLSSRKLLFPRGSLLTNKPAYFRNL